MEETLDAVCIRAAYRYENTPESEEVTKLGLQSLGGLLAPRAVIHVLSALAQPRLEPGITVPEAGVSVVLRECECIESACVTEQTPGRGKGRSKPWYCFLSCTVRFTAKILFIAGRWPSSFSQ